MKATLLIALGALAAPTLLFGQSQRAETEFVGGSIYRSRCLLEPSGDKAAQYESSSGLSGGGSIFLAGMAGDIISAGFGALGAALEEASREKGLNVVGTTNYQFYQMKVSGTTFDAVTRPQIVVEPRMPDLLLHPTNSLPCLILSYRAKGSKAPTAVLDPELKAADFDRSTFKGIESQWESFGLPASPDVYVEAELQSRGDGFLVRPTLVWLRAPLEGAPRNKRLASELHYAFSVPGTASGSTTSTPFAVARIRLPPMSSGTLLRAKDLGGYLSPVLPLRPRSEVSDQWATAISNAYSAWLAAVRTESDSQAKLPDAQAKAVAPKATDTDKQAMRDLNYRIEDALRTKAENATTLNRLLSSTVRNVGATNVNVRFTMVRDANRFGLAIAQALTARGATLGQSVTAALTASEWTAADTQYLIAMDAVATAQRALDAARQQSDQDIIFAAEQTLRLKKAEANTAAVTAKRSLPFPGLI